MLLTHETTIVLNKNDANIVGHMCYAAYKLWNVCNYERNNYKNLGLEKYPDWYYQTCYDNAGKTFIIGREYFSLSYSYGCNWRYKGDS